MLAIRMQRTGRKGHAQFRLIVQESRRSPSSGNVVAALGSYDPHTKAIILDKDKAATFLSNGAQPSPRVAMLLQKEGVKLPSWVKIDNDRQRSIKHTDKLRRNRPATSSEEVADKPDEPKAEEPAAEEPQEQVSEAVAEEKPAAEAPAEEAAAPKEPAAEAEAAEDTAPEEPTAEETEKA